MQFELFDPTQDVYIRYGRLPHWEQAGTTCFITWRTVDSIPVDVLRRWRVERAGWLRRRNIDPHGEGVREQLRALPKAERRDYHERFTERWMQKLDDCAGACVLRHSELSRIVADNLLHLDGAEYFLAAFVVMPNHVHVLVQLSQEDQLERQCKAWKHYSATKINRALGNNGRFWQRESFDHLVRSPEQFEYLLGYIARNPAAAKLRAGEYQHYQRPEQVPHAVRNGW
jgi:REP element-mobilizing transposase RayT